MTPPPPPPRPAPTADAPGVRLDVRVGTGRAVGYQMAADEFLIGGADGCDVRLPGSHLPPLVCRIARTPDGLRLNKLDPAFPVLLNGAPVAGPDPAPVANGDRIAVGPADVTVSVGTNHLRPRFVPINPPGPGNSQFSVLNTPQSGAATANGDSTPVPIAAAAADPLAAEREELALLRARLDEQARELEADRVLWYRRRQEIEAEAARHRGAAPTADRDLAHREQEVAQAREELAALRQSLSDQYRERREQLAQMQEVVQGATAALQQRQQELDERERRLTERADRLAAAEAEAARLRAELAARDESAEAATADLVRREAQIEVDREAVRNERDRLADEFARLERRQATLAERQLSLDRRAAEVDERFEQLRRDARELEEQVRLAGAERDRLAAEAARLEKVRADQESQAGRLADRGAQLEAQQAMLAVLRARLDRQQEEARQEAAQLATDRGRLDEARAELDARLREAERLRAELTTAREGQAEQERLAAERTALLDATLAEIHQQKDALAAEQARLRDKEAELDARSSEFAEQAAILKARATQVMDLQERLEADRAAVREREAALTEADAARQTFQEQLRRRAEELSARSKALDETARQLTDERADLDRLRAGLQSDREEAERTLAAVRDELASRAADLDRRAAELADRESSLGLQVARLREAGRAVAAARKELAEAHRRVEADREQIEAFRARALEEVQALRREAPDLEDRAQAAVDRLTASRDVIRGHLAELSAYAAQTRAELDAARAELRAEADRLRDREQAVERARAEHRLAVTEFRQQLLDWQARVGELKQTLARGESRLEARQAEVAAAAKQTDEAALELARQSEELRRERRRVAERRTEVERHLADMREWYRKKLRELAAGNADRGSRTAESNPIAGRIGEPPTAPVSLGAPEDVDPGDKQLGELLRSLELVDADTLDALWTEARRQRRPLRRVLLTSGAVTLYQLAMIEAGNLDALVLGRLRVVDRVRVTPREAVYRVFDPDRGGVFLLRHLAEAEMEDAVRPDEFRQRFAAARDAAHPNLAATVEVLEVNGRPAALQEWLTGPPSGDWPAEAAAPGVWVKLVADAAAALAAAHRAGLVHGRLTSDSFLLTPDGRLKVTGFGEPLWLAGGPQPSVEPTPEADLRALGQVAFGWTQLGQPTGRRRRKPFPESLLAVVRRLEADAETPMADTAARASPYRTADDLVADLARLAALFPCPADAWEQLARHAAEHVPDTESELRQSA
jgi:chromosome segregation ATPase